MASTHSGPGPGSTLASTSSSSSASNSALTPIVASERVFQWNDHAALWFSLGVGLLVMQIGAYLVPAVGSREAVIAILLGSVVGSGLLAWTARLGCETGLSSAGLMHATFGSKFGRLPVLLNMAQLIGWTTFELVIMRDATAGIGKQSFGLALGGLGGVAATTLLWGAVLVALLAGSMTKVVRKLISRVGLPLVVASLIWLTWQFGSQLQTQGLGAFWARPGDGSMGMLSAMDLVIAMPVSWLPLVADYARHGKSGRSAMSGTWLGYALANIWCYALGVLVVSVAQPDTDLVTALLMAQGGLMALSLILIDEIDNAYGDVYSCSVSGHSLKPRWSVRQWGIGVAVVCTALAMVLPMHSLEPFLLVLSSVFVPLFGVILGRLAMGSPDLSSSNRKVDWTAAGLWLVGIACYHLLGNFAPQWGSALPTLALTFTLAWLTRPATTTLQEVRV
ncbi:purine-cytosine permease family protein [Rhodoferax antarcticus]|uniref:Permease for cytosine/purine, uracil, thiamine, allantoin family protein n=1 Tax=Rhodoferax antarcticus ANT.BR TaxID=1111071 RepID=A0A1Q8YC40_9BURK|nr:cytosine permease [Rhodoferax antarcticus]APW48354.1 allantoin permease [Rhodoferax antarcticus]OLP05577.1 permease for cytosine/purine, uracil, thiamine, allantoin family protein [Rhodoferax antarcticus ANT.BR]